MCSFLLFLFIAELSVELATPLSYSSVIQIRKLLFMESNVLSNTISYFLKVTFLSTVYNIIVILHGCRSVYFKAVLIFVFKGVRRQASLAFSLFGCLLAHGDLRNNKLNQLAVNLWNLSHKHGFCETRTSVSHLHTHAQMR